MIDILYDNAYKKGYQQAIEDLVKQEYLFAEVAKQVLQQKNFV